MIDQSVITNPRFLDQASSLHRFIDKAPYYPRCSDNKTAILVRPREYALRYPYMQANRPDMVSWLIFDLDHDNPYIWEDENLPTPNFVVTDRNSGHSHLFYAISPVCTSKQAHSKPIRYMKAISQAMATRLKADLAYSGPVAKTPGHPWWSTQELHNHQYDLADFLEYVELDPNVFWRKEPDLDQVSHSRHCMLFEVVRFYAYSVVNQYRSSADFNGFSERVEAFALKKNDFSGHGHSTNLPMSSIRATVKSITRWTWDKYTGNREDIERGAMDLPDSMPLQNKQRRSAKRTHQKRREAAQQKIMAAINTLASQARKITQAALAKLTGISRQTIAKYLTVEFLRAAAVVRFKSLFQGSRNVKNGVYQITAASRPKGCRAATPIDTRPPQGGMIPVRGPIFRPAQRSPDRFITSERCHLLALLGFKWERWGAMSEANGG